MAKWGEGDPRWIVEQRADATNVNNWHWTERDVSSWSTEKLKELLQAVVVKNEDGSCEVSEVSSLDGEASINNRKGKLIFFYEWTIKLKWTGTSQNGVKYKGFVEVPNFSDENDIDEIEVKVNLSKDEPDTKLLALMKTDGGKQIRKALDHYVQTLKTEFTQGMILPKANGIENEGIPKAVPKADTQKIVTGVPLPKKVPVGVKIPTCNLNLRESFLTSPEELYRIFVTQELVQGFTHAPAVVEPDKGGKFRLLDGSVVGEFLELIPEQKIVMKWRFKSWPEGHFATITLNFIDTMGETELHVECKGVPVSDEERTREGWQRYYFSGIKNTFGYGARLC
ncbi:activator of 90 kDa heat shock protein ATPase homolog 1 isoform X1 [Protopterus annectens]|uniref:activator of 90 kDa heat shock protein ATPase homolog 1 isoform X1 n=1 Tax=Protopterus annectens TaxID=7888 RepID=UPI001CFB8E0B|nr:activator of 90 kDa heat shock protein ATPase homolog 1 isoform X1 [Protopterus annectens]